MIKRFTIKDLALNVSIVLLMIFSFSCNKKLEITPEHAYGQAVAWNTMDDINSNFFAVYALFRATMATNNDYLLWGELRGGDFASVQRADLKAVIDGNLNAPFPQLDEMRDWRRFYAVINAANLFIERSPEVLKKDGRYTQALQLVDVAHMRCLRAWAYFMLVRIWGDVPLLTSSYEGQFPTVARTDKSLVLGFCEKELLSAMDYLPFYYGGSDPIQSGNYHNYDFSRFSTTIVGRLGAYGLLAHIAAWQGRYADVDVYAKFVMDYMSQGRLTYSTTADITASNGVFKGRGQVGSDNRMLLGFTLFWDHGETGTSGFGHIESWTLATPYVAKSVPDLYVPSDSITLMFNDPQDQRFRFDTVQTSVVDSTRRVVAQGKYIEPSTFFSATPMFTKIKVFTSGKTTDLFAVFGSNIMFSRMEEIALLRAEACAAIGNTTDALSILNGRRANRGEAGYDAKKDGDLIDAVFMERRRELLGEAWRWYDLVRYNKLKRTNPAFNKLIDQGGIYWPVSTAVMEANPLIKQNPYWEGK
ncbi:MAG: RagB/SusD family nutrient uptake outer membrane protein [Niabella sp.]|nr:RagB/SusD family nutrient uptake outer membrane protein [Niabella sp.]